MVSDFNKKRNREVVKNKILFQAGGVLLIIIVATFIVADFKIYQRKRDLALQIDSYKKQIEEIKKNNETLKEQIANSDNSEYLEKIAYEQGMVKKGEKEVIFVMPEQKPAQPSAQNNFWPSWLSGAWNWIKSKF